MARRFVVVLTVLNVALLLSAVSGAGSSTEEASAPVVRASVLELVDDRGEVRSRLEVEASGEVVLRLFGEDGTIRVKLGASEGGSGLLLLDEATEPAIHMVARRRPTDERSTTTRISLQGMSGEPRVFRP